MQVTPPRKRWSCTCSVVKQVRNDRCASFVRALVRPCIRPPTRLVLRLPFTRAASVAPSLHPLPSSLIGLQLHSGGPISFRPSLPADCGFCVVAPRRPATVQYWLEDGCTTDTTAHQGKFADPSSSLGEVQCCSNDGSSCIRKDTAGQCFSGDDDAAKKTYFEAVAICAAQGRRLCTKTETVADKCCGSGCSTDRYLAWTSTSFSGQCGRSLYLGHFDRLPCPQSFRCMLMYCRW